MGLQVNQPTRKIELFIVTALPLGSLVCVISARRFGDAIINASLIKNASAIRPDLQWVVWTKPEFSPLFKAMGIYEIVTSEFPIAGGSRKVLRDGFSSLVKAIYKLRKLPIDASIDFTGDAREAMLGAMISGSKHHSPRWDQGHWMKSLIWAHKIPFVQYVSVSSNFQDVYQFQPMLLSTLLGKPLSFPSINSDILRTYKIAFHPFPSAKFRFWPLENWRKLSQHLIAKGITPTILCSSNEALDAHQAFDGDSQLHDIKICSSLENLIEEIGKIDLLVGVDSFLIHLAAALGKKTISITAGHLPQWWNPPEGIAIGQSGGCSVYPCANQPRCLGTPTESACIKSISIDQVASTIDSFITKK